MNQSLGEIINENNNEENIQETIKFEEKETFEQMTLF